MVSYVSVGAILIIFNICVAAFCSSHSSDHKKFALRRLREAARRKRRMRKAADSPRLPRHFLMATQPPADDGYDPTDDLRKSIEFAYTAIRERVAAGGKGWSGWPAPDDHVKGTAEDG